MFLYIILSEFLTKHVLDTCSASCDWTLVQVFSQGNFYFLYQYSVRPTGWNVANIGAAWGSVIYEV